jgi:lipoprotein signal peptidase
MNRRLTHLIYAIGGGFILLAIDFITKLLANAQLPFEKVTSTFLPFLMLYRTHNTGYHFIFGIIDNHFVWALTGLVFVIIIIVSLARSLIKDELDRGQRIIYMVILSLTIGAMGNVIEILAAGHATDFFIFKPFPWPSNLCDQYINGILYIILPIMIIKSIIDHRRQKAAQNPPSDSSEQAD